MKSSLSVFWFRRDLRLSDNAGLYQALRSGFPVLPLFIFDRNILDQLEDSRDSRITFIYRALESIEKELRSLGSGLIIYNSTPLKAFADLIIKYEVAAVYCNHDYEPYAGSRDQAIKQFLQSHSIAFHSFKDQVIFDRDEILKDDHTPYTVFTPFSRKWKMKLDEFYIKPYKNHKHLSSFVKRKADLLPSLAELGFHPSDLSFPPPHMQEDIIRDYDRTRDFPGLPGTSRLSVHLRFGTISIRKLVKMAMQWNGVFLNELIWREFYQMIIWQFPHVGQGKSFKREYDSIAWRNDESEFRLWMEGKTGYPIVDAGMRELNTTGYMHNRVRMIVASFLSKHLLIDWRWGEAYFAQKLLDFDLAANNGGWQWAAGCGCDAAPYFRIFNPYLQAKKFDPRLTYVRKWVPEWESLSYPLPVVDHKFARERCLKVYGTALKQNKRI